MWRGHRWNTICRRSEAACGNFWIWWNFWFWKVQQDVSYRFVHVPYSFIKPIHSFLRTKGKEKNVVCPFIQFIMKMASKVHEHAIPERRFKLFYKYSNSIYNYHSAGQKPGWYCDGYGNWDPKAIAHTIQRFPSQLCRFYMFQIGYSLMFSGL